MIRLLRKARWLFLIVLVIASVFRVSLFAATQSADARLWEGLADGRYVAVMRHALAPGVGDPDNFTLGDCSTQRNLSESGREQAKAIGDVMRAQGVTEARVYSSEWCRCLETAEGLAFTAVTPKPALNSFFQRRAASEEQTQSLREFLRTERNTHEPLVLVTHQVNITALTGVFPASGEIVVIGMNEAGDVEVKGRLKPVSG